MQRRWTGGLKSNNKKRAESIQQAKESRENTIIRGLGNRCLTFHALLSRGAVKVSVYAEAVDRRPREPSSSAVFFAILWKTREGEEGVQICQSR